MEIKIDKNIPMPKLKIHYPFKELEIGDSFFVPGKKITDFGGSINNAKPKKFTLKSVEEKGVKGIRIWRIK